jgi:hypothetical protein
MSDSDEKRLEDEDVAEAPPEQEDEGTEVEGHTWVREAGKVSDPGKAYKPS